MTIGEQIRADHARHTRRWADDPTAWGTPAPIPQLDSPPQTHPATPRLDAYGRIYGQGTA